jgi:hypothetical protein
MMPPAAVISAASTVGSCIYWILLSGVSAPDRSWCVDREMLKRWRYYGRLASSISVHQFGCPAEPAESVKDQLVLLRAF